MSFQAEEIAEAWNQVNKALAAGSGKDQQRIAEIGLCVVGLLLRKNVAYGSSVFEPMGIFAKGAALDQIHVRIDDKLARIARGHAIDGEDTTLDLAGYLILELVARERV